MKNNYLSKFIRNSKAFLPVQKGRVGECNRCGECCKLPNVCPFLRYDKEDKCFCAIYPIRFRSCRKYPRTAKEHITKDVCGFYFQE